MLSAGDFTGREMSVAKMGLEPINLSVLDFESSASAIPPLRQHLYDTLPSGRGQVLAGVTPASPGFAPREAATFAAVASLVLEGAKQLDSQLSAQSSWKLDPAVLC